MLKVPQLDDLTYEQIVNRSISRIPAMTDQWTDFNSHDPGITVLQTYAWLVDMLNFYMNATGDVHVEKYLKLLGITPNPAKESEGYVILENLPSEVTLTKGTRFYAGDIPFELAEDYQYQWNRFSSFVQEIDDTAMDLTAFAGIDGEFIEVFSEQFLEKTVAYFGFEKTLKDADKLYINVKEDKKRNPFGEQFKFGELQWEYYTAEGWKTLEVTDETSGFLKSGFVKIHFTEPMEAWKHPDGFEKAYYIRCTLTTHAYDCIPQIGNIYVNPMKVLQKSTICQKGEVLEHLQIGTTNGCANQNILFDYPDVYRFSLLVTESEEHPNDTEIWTRVDCLEEADYKDQVFTYDAETKMICFGDGIHGMVPIQNHKIFVTGLEISKLDQGNVLSGEIRETDCNEIAGAKIYNPAATVGGRKKEDLHDMLRRMEDTLFVQKRMASEQDYEQIILETPGLMLDLAHVIPGTVYGDIHRKNCSINEVVVVVKPYSQSITPKLSAIYRNMIEQYIEKYRLINTKVSIVSPIYVGIEVNAKIHLHKNTAEIRDKVKKCIEEHISYQKKAQPFGNVISYGKLFTGLESMEEIKWVQELALEKNGVAAVKNDRGDILCQEDALSYVERFDIEFI